VVFKSELKQSDRQTDKQKGKRYKLPLYKKCTALKGDMLYNDYTNRGYVNTMYPFDDVPSECEYFYVGMHKKTGLRHRNKHKVHFNDTKY
jgi:hypothetical protein